MKSSFHFIVITLASVLLPVDGIAELKCNTAKSCFSEVFHQSTAKADCSSFLVATVYNTPATFTTVSSTVTTTVSAFKEVNAKSKTTLTGSVPTYASACKNMITYSSACSCLGVTKSTITLKRPNPTTIVTKTSTKKSSYSTDTSYPTPSISSYTATASSFVGSTRISASTVTASNVLPTVTNVAMIAAASRKAVAYGHDNADDTTFGLTLNLNAIEGSQLVNIEDFIPFVSNIQCSGLSSTSQVVVKFSTDAAYKVASSWPQAFHLITSGTMYCGTADGERTFYNVTAVAYEKSSKSVTLSVTSVSISDVYQNYSINWGTTNTPPSNKRVKRSPDAISESTSFSFDADGFSYFYNNDLGDLLLPLGIENVNIYCDSTNADGSSNPCGIVGTVLLSGGFECDAGGCPGAYVSASLQNAHAAVDFEISATNFTLSHTFTFLGFDIPSVSVGLNGDIFSLSGGADLIATVALEIIESVDISQIGFYLDLSGASITLDTNHGLSTSGIDLRNSQVYTPQISGLDYHDLSATGLDTSISFGPQLSLGFAVLGVGYSASLTLNSPTISMTFDGGRGLPCDTGNGAFNYGLAADVNLVAGISGPGVPESYNSITLADTGEITLVDNACIAL